MAPVRLLAALSLVFFALRLLASLRVGFGDAEALYVAYGLHPQPTYLDHPGLVGAVARLLGRGGAPSALHLHLLTSLAATAVPWLGALAARLLGAPARSAPLAGLALLAAPEITVGLFALTPDLLLAPLWLLSAGLWGAALAARPGSTGAALRFVGAALCAGLAASAKVPGLLLLAALSLSLLTPSGRHHRRSLAPWLALAAALLVIAPAALYELRAGLPMLRHRLVNTQHQSGFSLRNVGALLGGQLAYLSPLIAAGAWLTLRALLRPSAVVPPPADLTTEASAGSFAPGQRSAPEGFLSLLTVTAAIPLALLCLWSRVAEPHWMAPAWLALALAVPWTAGALPGWLRRWGLASGVALSVIVHAWTLTDLAPRYLGGAYEARYDLANDLFNWAPVAPRLASLRAAGPGDSAPVVVTPHWIIAAQVEATSPERLRVTTTAALSPGEAPGDDYGRWEPPTAWQREPLLLWVSDDRFGLELPALLAEREVVSSEVVELRRGGRVVRRTRLALCRQRP